MPEITRRKEAIALGLTRYFTGKACCNGHVSLRYTYGGCIECSKQEHVKQRARRKGNREYLRIAGEQQRKRRIRNHQKIIDTEAKYRERNREKIRAYKRSEYLKRAIAFEALKRAGIHID